MDRIGRRQAVLLVREAVAFQELWELRDWPCIIAGGKNPCTRSSLLIQTLSRLQLPS